MSVAAWLVWREPVSAERRRALGVFIGQLVLNAIWTPVFFGLFPLIGASALWIAMVVIVALDVMVLVTMVRFWPVRRVAAVLLIPYWVWVLYASTLNLYLALHNG
jgi:benzodiazapine receptor